MYRAVTLYGIRHGAIRLRVVDAEALERMLPRIGISFVFNPAREASDVYLDGENVEGPIRSLEVSEAVSRVSQIGARAASDSWAFSNKWDAARESSWTAATSGRSSFRMPS